jgi:hypothetical protein
MPRGRTIREVCIRVEHSLEVNTREKKLIDFVLETVSSSGCLKKMRTDTHETPALAENFLDRGRCQPL